MAAINVKHDLTVHFDREFLDAWIRLRVLKNKSFSEFMKEVLLKENLKYSTYHITESVENISGTLKTKLDYKTLRDTMIEERVRDYENMC